MAKEGAGREIQYQHASPEIKAELDKTRRKEWDNWKGYSNMEKITKAQFEEMKAADPSLKIIPTRWVDTDKAEIGQPSRLKSRFVVRGDLEDASMMRTDSPTGSQVAMGLLLSYAAANNSTLRSGDISAAFLQGSVLDRKLVLSMPKGQAPYDVAEDELVVVSTTVYGTKDAPRGWFKNLDGTLLQGGLRRVPLEAGFYVLNGKDGKGDMQKLMAQVQAKYKFGSLEERNFKYCGRWIRQTDQGILVNCPDLITRVRPIQMEARRRNQAGDVATEAERGQLRSVVGSLNWLVRVCRPDLAYSVARLQTSMCKPSAQDLKEANNLIQYVNKTKDKGLFYPAKAINFDDAMIMAIQDASYAADYDQSISGLKMGHRSQSGRMLCLTDKKYECEMTGHLYMIEWHSTVIRRVCRSTLQAEALSLQLGAMEADHARAVIHGLYLDMGKMNATQWMVEAQDRVSVTWVTDCFSLWSHLMNPAAGSVADKRLAVDLCALRQELWREKGQSVGDPLASDRPPDEPSTKIFWTSTDRMIADGLTKRLTYSEPLEKLMSGNLVSLVPSHDQKNNTGVKASM